MSLLSFEEKYCLATQTATSVAKFRLNDRIKGTAFTNQPTGLSGFELDGASWSIAHHHPTRNSFFKIRKSMGAQTSLTLSQAVPNNKWFLVPTPAVKLTQKGSLGEHNVAEIGWDTLTRTGSGAVTIYGGEDKEYKASVKHHTALGTTATLRAKLRKGLLHSIAATAGSVVPPQLLVKSRLDESGMMKGEVGYDLRNKILKFEAKRSGQKPASGGPSTSTTMEAYMPIGKGAMNTTPRVVIGVKVHF